MDVHSYTHICVNRDCTVTGLHKARVGVITVKKFRLGFGVKDGPEWMRMVSGSWPISV